MGQAASRQSDHHHTGEHRPPAHHPVCHHRHQVTGAKIPLNVSNVADTDEDSASLAFGTIFANISDITYRASISQTKRELVFELPPWSIANYAPLAHIDPHNQIAHLS